MPPYQASPPQKSSRHRWLILATFVVVIVAGVISFIFNGTGESEKEKMEDYQIVDVTIPPPPPPPPQVEEDEFEEPEEIEEFIEPLEMSSDTSSSSEESSEVDLGIDIGDLVASSGAGGFALDIPRFGRGGGGGDGSGDSLGGGELDSPATPASKSQPIYPAALLKKGVGGKVLVSCTVSPEGLTLSASIKQSSGHPDLDKAAIAAVNRWKFKPGTKAGKKVKSIVIVPFNFEVKKI